MKKYLALTIASIAFVALLATTAQAQTTGSPIMRAHIPFAFNVGRTELPAGEYNIAVLNPSSDHKVLQIRSTDGRVGAIVNTLGTTAQAPDKSKLVFRCYGEKYFFAQAQVTGESTALTTVKSSVERTEERVVARHRGKATVTIAAE
jgi:hypothetical protein